MSTGPHNAQPILSAGSALATAAGALILLHGRGGNAEEMLSLGAELAPKHWALFAPQAGGQTWYPNSFLAPREQNEPYLSSALRTVHRAVNAAAANGLPVNRIVVAGFSQGACLATEFVGRNPQRYGGLIAFTGGLIGPQNVPLELSGDLAGTPVLLSSGDPAPHVPWSRVEESARLLEAIGGRVAVRRHPGRAHTISMEEIQVAEAMLGAI